MNKIVIISGIVLVLFLLIILISRYFGISFFRFHTQRSGEIQPQNGENIYATPEPTIANPASVNCSKLGGTLSHQKRGDGSEYGLCTFDDNRACEEWAMFNNECPKGGVKTTGFDTIEQKYCAWRGGKTVAEKDAPCTLPNGTTCSVTNLYKGSCVKSAPISS